MTMTMTMTMIPEHGEQLNAAWLALVADDQGPDKYRSTYDARYDQHPDQIVRRYVQARNADPVLLMPIIRAARDRLSANQAVHDGT